MSRALLAGLAVLSLGLALGPAISADLAPAPAPPPVLAQSAPSLSGWEIRGGGLVSTWGPEKGNGYINGEIVAPKFYTLQGWQNFLIPRLQFGVMGNVSGGTNYVYAGPLWTVNYNRFLAEFFLGGAVHDGQVNGHYFDPSKNKLGCRALYHVGWGVGYQLTEHWNTMVTFDHVSNGAGTLSNCHENQGISAVGLRIGYDF